jgi:DNA polymerase
MTAIAPPPPPPLLAGFQMPVGPYVTTILAEGDFETFSTAGFVWQAPTEKKPYGSWACLPGAAQGKKGLSVIGARIYAEHASTEVLTFTYDLKDGKGKRRWRPGMPNPQDLFDHLAGGGLFLAHNAMFEKLIWEFVCCRKYGWPMFDYRQFRCSAAKSRAWGLPSSLADVGSVLQLATQKDKEGTRLMKLFSWPRDPTKKDPRWRILPSDEPEEAEKFYNYCDTDVEVEGLISEQVPDLIPQELDYYLADQAINRRGIGVDLEMVHHCIAIVNQVLDAYDDEMFRLIGLRTSQAQKLVAWLANEGVVDQNGRPVSSLAAKDGNLEFLYDTRNDYPALVSRILELRCLCASASVKKVFAMANHANCESRLSDLFIYHGARTGRDTHADVQPGNLPKAGPDLRWCADETCLRPYGKAKGCCPWCGASAAFSSEESPQHKDKGWCFEGVEPVLEIIATRSMDALNWFFGDALLCVSGVIRSLFIAAPGHRLICSDYSSIEAVVTATISGEQWRIEAFERKEDIYLHGAASVTGKTYEWYMANGGKKHPDRQKVGKIAELALGFQGFSGALFAFGFDGDKAAADEVWKAWRAASPAIVEMWGGQFRGLPWAPTSFEFFGLEGMAVLAVLNPGKAYAYRGFEYQVLEDVLYCKLLSGRRLAYHKPRLTYDSKRDGWAKVYSLTYMTWNTNPTYGARGWVRMETYAGRLFENVVQATARDIMAIAVVKLERSGYPVVLRVHDEIAAEVPNGFGSLAEFESIMCDLPDWAKGWPIRAAGYEAVRYHKD